MKSKYPYLWWFDDALREYEDSTIKLLHLIYSFSKATGYKSNTKICSIHYILIITMYRKTLEN